jgi:hypothetical protein
MFFENVDPYRIVFHLYSYFLRGWNTHGCSGSPEQEFDVADRRKGRGSNVVILGVLFLETKRTNREDERSQNVSEICSFVTTDRNLLIIPCDTAVKTSNLTYYHVYHGCVGSMTNNTTRVRIGYRIYSLWRFTAAHITITDY